MVTFICRVVFTVALAAIASQGVQVQVALAPSTSPEEAAVRELWSTLDASWNARDAARFSVLFSEQASMRFLDGALALEGREAIHEHFTKQFSRQAPDLNHVTSILDTHRLSADVVAVDGRVEVVRVTPGTTTQPTPLRRFAVFAVMKRTANGLGIDLLRVFPLSMQPQPAK